MNNKLLEKEVEDLYLLGFISVFFAFFSLRWLETSSQTFWEFLMCLWFQCLDQIILYKKPGEHNSNNQKRLIQGIVFRYAIS